jgi:hypothetical protein
MLTGMARRRTEVDALAERIIALRDADLANLLARLMTAEGRRVDWSVITRIRRRLRGQSTAAIEREVGKAVREVRRERARAS